MRISVSLMPSPQYVGRRWRYLFSSLSCNSLARPVWCHCYWPLQFFRFAPTILLCCIVPDVLSHLLPSLQGWNDDNMRKCRILVTKSTVILLNKWDPIWASLSPADLFMFLAFITGHSSLLCFTKCLSALCHLTFLDLHSNMWIWVGWPPTLSYGETTCHPWFSSELCSIPLF
jgi:hypothetical protein